MYPTKALPGQWAWEGGGCKGWWGILNFGIGKKSLMCVKKGMKSLCFLCVTFAERNKKIPSGQKWRLYYKSQHFWP